MTRHTSRTRSSRTAAIRYITENGAGSEVVRLCIYARISIDKDGHEIRVENQVKDSTELITNLIADEPRQFVNTGHIFTDDAISAYSGAPRPGYEAMCRAIESGQVSGVALLDQSRLVRRMRDLIGLIELVDRTGFHIYPVNGTPYDLESANGKAMARNIVNMGEWESDIKGERLRAWSKGRADRGLAPGGGKPYGYEHANCLAIVAEEALVIREAYDRVVNGGESLGRVVTDFNTRNIPAPKGGHWHYGPLHNVLLNPRTAGLTEYPPRSGTFKNGTWSPIIDRNTWDRYRVMTGHRPRRTPNDPYVLAGVIDAVDANGEHVNKMGGHISQGHRYYFAYNNGDHNVSRKGGNIRAEDVESFVYHALRAMAGKMPKAATTIDDTEVRILRARLTEAEAEAEALTKSFEAGSVATIAEYGRLSAVIQGHIAEAKAELALVEPDTADPILAVLSNSPAGFERAWDAATHTERVRLVRAVFERVEVRPAVVLGRYARSPEAIAARIRLVYRAGMVVPVATEAVAA